VPLSSGSLAMGHRIKQGMIKRGLKSKLPKEKPKKSRKPMLSNWSKTKVIKEIFKNSQSKCNS
jgi:hypothetical protein